MLIKAKFLTELIHSTLPYKDGNGDLIPDSPRGIPLIGDGDGISLVPMGILLVANQFPSGLAGTGM
jgi:hypothetical protein